MRILYDRYNHVLRSLAQDCGINCIDTAAYFDEKHDHRRGQLFADTCHMLKEGHTEMARFISEEIINKSII